MVHTDMTDDHGYAVLHWLWYLWVNWSIEITVQEEREFINESQLNELEKYIRLHYELDINMAGLEAISHLLKRVTGMQQQMAHLQSKLRLYERL